MTHRAATMAWRIWSAIVMAIGAGHDQSGARWGGQEFGADAIPQPDTKLNGDVHFTPQPKSGHVLT